MRPSTCNANGEGRRHDPFPEAWGNGAATNRRNADLYAQFIAPPFIIELRNSGIILPHAIMDELGAHRGAAHGTSRPLLDCLLD
jgi:hypothetical protein